jgi:predicted acylesterase/phospholipase RssA
MFEDLRLELQPIHVFRTLVNLSLSIKIFAGRSAGARNAAKASSENPCA